MQDVPISIARSSPQVRPEYYPVGGSRRRGYPQVATGNTFLSLNKYSLQRIPLGWGFAVEDNKEFSGNPRAPADKERFTDGGVGGKDMRPGIKNQSERDHASGLIVCAWCRRPIGTMRGEGVSHGICLDCKARELARWRAANSFMGIRTSVQ